MENSGIYQIKNLINNKRYIGRASFLDKRRTEHFRLLKLNVHTNDYLQKSYNKYGVDNFEFSVLEYCNIDKLIEREDYWCKHFNTNDKSYGYNIAITDSSIGFYKHSEETKIKMSNSAKGKPKSFEQVEKMKISLLGRKKSDESKLKAKEWYLHNEHPMKKGHSEETKLQMSINRKGKPSNNKRKIIAIIESENKEIPFASLNEAALFFNIKVTSISNNLSGLSKTVKIINNKIKFKYD